MNGTKLTSETVTIRMCICSTKVRNRNNAHNSAIQKEHKKNAFVSQTNELFDSHVMIVMLCTNREITSDNSNVVHITNTLE